MGIFNIVKKFAGKYLPKVASYFGDWIGKKLKDKGLDMLGEGVEKLSRARNVEDIKETGKHIVAENVGRGVEKLNPLLKKLGIGR